MNKQVILRGGPLLFVVVADEVRNLAMRTAEAAKSTSALIEGNITNIKSGSALVQETDAAFDGVTESAAKVAELVGEIAAASNEQAQGIDQINNAASETDKVTQQVAATAEEVAASSEELSSQAEMLKGMVDELTVLVDGAHQRVRSGGGKDDDDLVKLQAPESSEDDF